jgi:hypothetical protein
MAKKMVIAFFDQQGAIFTNCVLLVITVNYTYIVLVIFMKQLKQKRVVAAAAGQWFLCWNEAQVHIASFFVLVAGKAQHADFVLFSKVKDHLDNITLTQDTLKSTWERAIMTVNTEEFAAAYRR